MKKSLISLALLASFGAQAQTATLAQVADRTKYIKVTQHPTLTSGVIEVTNFDSRTRFNQNAEFTAGLKGNNGISITGGTSQFYQSNVSLTGGSTLDVGGHATFHSGATVRNGLNMTGSSITGVRANWEDGNSAVNVNQINARTTILRQEAATESVRVNGRIDNTNERVTVIDGKVVDLRTDLTDETAARIEGDKRAAAEANSYADAGDARTLNQANAYSDAGDRRTLNQANSYTDTQIGKVRQEIAGVRKELNGVGAMAMAASVVGGVSVADGKKNAVTAAVGQYGDSTAIAIGVTRIVAPNARIFGTLSRATGSRTGAGLGASLSF